MRWMAAVYFNGGFFVFKLQMEMNALFSRRRIFGLLKRGVQSDDQS